MAQQRIELAEPLSGRHLILDPDELTFGLFEDFESGRVAAILDALARLIVGGDLPHGTDRAGLRRLKVAEMGAVMGAVRDLLTVPKSG